ncbi:MAG: lactate racemase domain-containing protein [Clostridia bacterium]|nr:lactate racemase domain-containing protein [Clostridia bacterium]
MMYTGSDQIQSLVKDAFIPRFARVRQAFARPRVDDIPAELAKELSRPALAQAVKPGMRIAITAGSRGVANIPLILREIGALLKARGAIPFIVPAMGSHGGATAEGQRQLIESYGITEDFCGMPILSSMEVIQIGATEAGEPVCIDRNAAQADGIIVVGRVKAHTDFHGPYESGLMKMMVIGLGKQHGAELFHARGCAQYAKRLPEYGKAILKHAPVLFGVALIENAYDETAMIAALTPEEIIEKEPGLLLKAKTLMGKLLFHDIDLLIVDQIGKEISGEGMDPNVTGRFATPYASGGSDAKSVCVLDLTDNSHGAFVGIGMADVTTMRVYNKADFEKSYVNQLTSTIFLPSKFPIVLENDRTAIQACLKYCGDNNKNDPRVVRILDTKHLEEILISEALLGDAAAHPDVTILSDPRSLVFDSDGNLF